MKDVESEQIFKLLAPAPPAPAAFEFHVERGSGSKAPD